MQFPRRRQHDPRPHQSAGIGRRSGLTRILCALALSACGGGEGEAQAPIAHEGPDDQIFRVSRAWEAQVQEKGFRTAPSRIAMFETAITSRVTFGAGSRSAKESLRFASSFKLADGRAFQCEARAEMPVQVVFGDHAGEAAVEIRRPALHLTRRCTPADFPEPDLDLPATAARFALRGDRLVAIAPPTDRREYLPAE